MRFQLIDRIDLCQPGKLLKGSKFLTLGEEYLADHFPRFPVMPGVLMLQSLVEAGAWLWRATVGYRHTVIVMHEVKNVKYGSFMQPGHRMDISVELVEQGDTLAKFKGKGVDDEGKTTVAAQFVLRGYSLASQGPAGEVADENLVRHWESRWNLLTGSLNLSPESTR